MPDSREIISMRHAQWERAKGELQAFLHYFWPEHNLNNGKPVYNDVFEIIDKAISDCIKTVDANL